MRIYIVYATAEGQTARIADYIAEVVRAHRHEAETVEIGHAKDGVPAGHDGVIVGSSSHMGKHEKHAAEFVRRNRQALEVMPSAFFSVSLAPHGVMRPKRRGTSSSSRRRRDGTRPRWRSSAVTCCARITGFVKRHMMKKIAGDKPGNLGTDSAPATGSLRVA